MEPRPTCSRCRRPTSACYCEHLTQLPTRTRVVILQHPRERHVPIGTARMASLCLPNAELHVGIDWSQSAALTAALSDPSRPAALLYPGEHARDVMRSPPDGPVTLIVVDGTWSQTKKVVRANPVLEALPRYAFTAPTPSDYQIRREPDVAYVSTIEALVHVLGALEGDAERFTALLAPFRAMVAHQVEHAAIPGRGRAQRPRGPRPAKRATPNARDDLVCVVGEVNAWPYRARQQAHPDELVHWVAYRLATGERFEHLIAPRNPLCDSTPTHLDVPVNTLLAGTSLAAFHAAWAAFSQDSDVLCAWGDFAPTQLRASGAAPLTPPLDARLLVRTASGGQHTTAERYLAAHAPSPSPLTPLGQGRAGRRLALLVATMRACAPTRGEGDPHR